MRIKTDIRSKRHYANKVINLKTNLKYQNISEPIDLVFSNLVNRCTAREKESIGLVIISCFALGIMIGFVIGVLI